MKKLSAAMLALALALSAKPAHAGKVKVHFTCTCDDPVGEQVATKLRDAFSVSPRYELTSQSAYKGEDGKEYQNWGLSIVSMDPDSPADGRSTIMSIVIQVGDDFLWTHAVRVCGIVAAPNCADQILSFLDNEIASTGTH